MYTPGFSLSQQNIGLKLFFEYVFPILCDSLPSREQATFSKITVPKKY